MPSITFITGNSGKAEQLSKYLGIPIAHKKIDLAEIQSLDLAEVVESKAREAYQQIKTPVLVDDTSLIIHALGRLPGPFVKFFLSEIGDGGICKLMKNYKDKSATATVAISYFDGTSCKVFEGTINGSIANSPAGDGGFGWDSIFIPEDYKETRASMNDEDYDKTSPRKFALEKLERYLNKL